MKITKSAPVVEAYSYYKETENHLPNFSGEYFISWLWNFAVNVSVGDFNYISGNITHLQEKIW